MFDCAGKIGHNFFSILPTLPKQFDVFDPVSECTWIMVHLQHHLLIFFLAWIVSVKTFSKWFNPLQTVSVYIFNVYISKCYSKFNLSSRSCCHFPKLLSKQHTNSNQEAASFSIAIILISAFEFRPYATHTIHIIC